MARPKGTEMLQNARLRRARAFVQAAWGGSACGDAATMGAVGGRGGQSTQASTIGVRMTAMPSTVRGTAQEKPSQPVRATMAGVTMMLPLLAPFSARLIAMPRFAWNHRPRMVTMAATLVAAQPNAISR
jgi:hypothetical protein